MCAKKRKQQQTVKVTEENAAYVPGNPDPDLMWVLDNPFVLNVHGQRIFYNNEFYLAMYKLMHNEGKTAVQAYQQLGFDVARLGNIRAEQAGKRANDKAKKNELFSRVPKDYDGSIPLDLMPELTQEEELAYLRSRVMFLEGVAEAKKKYLSWLAEQHTSSRSSLTTNP